MNVDKLYNTKKFVIVIILNFLLFSCSTTRKVPQPQPQPEPLAVLNINRNELIKYARTFLGTPYKYGSSDPSNGFDCSGFVFHVLTHFNAKPPRSSYNYENVGKVVNEKFAKPGDIILFTGSDKKQIGHMGFITENENGRIKFIHSATTKGIGVIENYLQGYYRDHFVKIIQIIK